MRFNSYIFLLLFLPLTVGGYFLAHKLGKHRFAKVYLLGMSLWFYGYFEWRYLLIMAASILVNYAMNRVMTKSGSKGLRRAAFIAGMTVNLGLLAVFKYADFFIANINAVTGAGLSFLRLVLPLGISFYTFQQVGYMIDSYHGKVPPYSFLDYALFVSFFPQLVAGPIVTHEEIVPQFADETKYRPDAENIGKGLYVLAFGLAKKVLLADTLGNAVNWAYANIPSLTPAGALLAMIAYMLQIYLDFAGYCDIATGCALMFNIKLPVNFDSPFRGTTIAEFWKRWHITLTRFFTTYVYFPLGGSREGTARACLNTMIVFTLSGFWHGAGWTYVLFGMAYGAMLVVCRIAKKQISRIRPWILWVVTFMLNMFNISMFRAESVGQAVQLWSRLGGSFLQGVPSEMFNAILRSDIDLVFNTILHAPSWLPFGILIAFAFCASVFMRNSKERLAVYKPGAGRSCVTVVLLLWSVLSLSGVTTFLYFNF